MKLYYFTLKKEHQEFKNYGEAGVILLAKHFASSDVDQFLAECSVSNMIVLTLKGYVMNQ